MRGSRASKRDQVEQTQTPRSRKAELDSIPDGSADRTECRQATEEVAMLAKFPVENPNPVLHIARDVTERKKAEEAHS